MQNSGTAHSSNDRMKSLKERLSIIISVLAFCISCVSFYLTVLRPAHLQIIAGSSIYIFHDIEGRASVAMSLSIANNGARPAVVERLGLLVRRPGEKNGYLLTPTAFQKINEKGEPQDESMVGAVVVPGRSETRKQLLFKASQKDDNFSITSRGDYHLIVLAWVGTGSSPFVADTLNVSLSDVDAAQLAHWLELSIPNSVVVDRLQWRQWQPGFLGNVDSLLGSVKQ